MKISLNLIGVYMVLFMFVGSITALGSSRDITEQECSTLAVTAQSTQENNKQGPVIHEEKITKKKSRTKLGLTQKLGFWLLKKKLRKSNKKSSVGKVKDTRNTHWGNIAGLSSGILALLDLILLGSGLLFVVGAICAIVFGAIGMKNSGEDKDYKGKGMGIAALILGIVEALAILLAIVAIAAWVSGV